MCLASVYVLGATKKELDVSVVGHEWGGRSWTQSALVESHPQCLVSEIGGTLSHRAVVAHEHGLPVVVNLSLATKRFRTGQIRLLARSEKTGRIADYFLMTTSPPNVMG